MIRWGSALQATPASRAAVRPTVRVACHSRRVMTAIGGTLTAPAVGRLLPGQGGSQPLERGQTVRVDVRLRQSATGLPGVAAVRQLALERRELREVTTELGRLQRPDPEGTYAGRVDQPGIQRRGLERPRGHRRVAAAVAAERTDRLGGVRD